MTKTEITNVQVAIFEFIFENGRLPKKYGPLKNETNLGKMLTKFTTPASKLYDKTFVSKLETTGVTKKGVKTRTQETLMSFVENKLRVPKYEIPEERPLALFLQNTLNHGETSVATKLAKTIKKSDRCFKSGIPFKYRASINEALVLLDENLKKE